MTDLPFEDPDQEFTNKISSLDLDDQYEANSLDGNSLDTSLSIQEVSDKLGSLALGTTIQVPDYASMKIPSSTTLGTSSLDGSSHTTSKNPNLRKTKKKHAAAKKKRAAMPCWLRKMRSIKRRDRRADPKVKQYVEKDERDVLLGRGGRSNHHPGNQVYLEHVREWQEPYKALARKDKKHCSQGIVQWVHDNGGRFLKRDGKEGPWYVVTDATACEKVSQALREDHTSEGRAAKKARSEAAKKARSEAKARAKSGKKK